MGNPQHKFCSRARRLFTKLKRGLYFDNQFCARSSYDNAANGVCAARLLLLCCCSCHATAADLVGIELGARQLQELGVEAAVLAALSQQAAARRMTLQLLPASQVNQA
jgi:hypothetical protein